MLGEARSEKREARSETREARYEIARKVAMPEIGWGKITDNRKVLVFSLVNFKNLESGIWNLSSSLGLEEITDNRRQITEKCWYSV